MNILIYQTAFLGDIVLSTPVISALRRLYPSSQISVVTTPLGASLLKKDPRLARIIVDDKKGKHKGFWGMKMLSNDLATYKFDRVYSLHKSWRTSLLLWLSKIPYRVGFSTAKLSFLYHQKMKRQMNLHDVERNLQLIEGSDSTLDCLSLYSDSSTEISKNPYIVIAPGSMWKTKRWSEVEFQQLVKKISTDIHVVLVGSKEEWQLSEQIKADSSNVENLCGTLPLEKMIPIVQNSAGVVCNDSMFLHVASAFKKPVVALFCATSPSFGFGPWNTPHRILESESLSCRPCRRHGSQNCPTGTERCRTDVKSYQVISALKELGCLN